jgi:IS5 family transposase
MAVTEVAMYRTQDPQSSFFGEFLYDRIIPPNHFLRKLKETVDFSFVNERCRELYAEAGRPCWEPALMFRVLFLQFLHDISDRDIEEQVNFNLAFKWFVGLEVDASAPDATSLVVFRNRLGTQTFEELFNRVVELARSKGLVSDKLHIIDSTQIQAKVDRYRIRKEQDASNSEPPTKPGNFPPVGSPDPDARYGRKGNKSFFGYKAHIKMDGESEIVTALTVTPVNVHDSTQFTDLLICGPAPQALTADKAYDAKVHHGQLAALGIRNGIIPHKNRGKSYGMERISKLARKYRPRIEHKIAEAKRFRGLAKARYWGLAKTTLQAFMTGIVVNLRRMVVLAQGLAPPTPVVLRRVTA